jgi:hypothetical protein
LGERNIAKFSMRPILVRKPAQPSMPQVGDKVIPQRSETVYEIFHLHEGGEKTRNSAHFTDVDTCDDCKEV